MKLQLTTLLVLMSISLSLSAQEQLTVKGLVSSQPSAMPSNGEYGIAAPTASAAPISDPIQTLTEQDLAQTDPADALPF